jgi:hypothetical protein
VSTPLRRVDILVVRDFVRHGPVVSFQQVGILGRRDDQRTEPLGEPGFGTIILECTPDTPHHRHGCTVVVWHHATRTTDEQQTGRVAGWMCPCEPAVIRSTDRDALIVSRDTQQVDRTTMGEEIAPVTLIHKRDSIPTQPVVGRSVDCGQEVFTVGVFRSVWTEEIMGCNECPIRCTCDAGTPDEDTRATILICHLTRPHIGVLPRFNHASSQE